MSAETPPDPVLREAVTTAEAAATRRRWINLGEFVAVVGLVIAGITLWLNWSERRSDLTARQAERSVEQRQLSRFEIDGAVTKSGDIVIRRDARHPLGDVRVTFPTALGVAQQSSPTQTIEKRWYEAALLKATTDGPDTRIGTLPIMLQVDYFDDDRAMLAVGTYDIVWKTEGRFLRGRALRIVGFKRRGGAIGQPVLDAAWAAAQRPAG